MTLHNLLFLVRKLISNKLIEVFDWLSCQKKRVFVGFCAGSKQKSEQKHETEKLVEFHNQPISINYDSTHVATSCNDVARCCVEMLRAFSQAFMLMLAAYVSTSP